MVIAISRMHIRSMRFGSTKTSALCYNKHGAEFLFFFAQQTPPIIGGDLMRSWSDEELNQYAIYIRSEISHCIEVTNELADDDLLSDRVLVELKTKIGARYWELKTIDKNIRRELKRRKRSC